MSLSVKVIAKLEFRPGQNLGRPQEGPCQNFLPGPWTPEIVDDTAREDQARSAIPLQD